MNRGPLVCAALGVVLVGIWWAVQQLGWTDQLTVISGTFPEGGLQPVHLGSALLSWALASIVAPVLLVASAVWATWNWASPMQSDTAME